MINDFIGLLFILFVLSLVAYFLKRKINAATAKEPQIDRVYLDKKTISLMSTINVPSDNFIGIGKKLSGED